MRVKGYIFDYGGTLDTGGNHWGKVLWHAYERRGLAVTEQQFREAYVHAERWLATHRVVLPSFTFRDTLEAKLRLQAGYLRERGCDMPEGCEAELLDDVYGQTLAHTERSVGVLRRLKESLAPASSESTAPMVLVSNFYGNIGVVLREFGFDGLFCSVVESAVVGIRKPDSRIFQLGVEALGLKPEEVVVVGDSIDKDIVPARSIGCHTVWIAGEPWDDSKPVDTTIPERVISSLEELL